MSDQRTYAEVPDSQEPAKRLLQHIDADERLCYTALTAKEVLKARGGSTSEVLLRSILEDQLRHINKIRYKGRT